MNGNTKKVNRKLARRQVQALVRVRTYRVASGVPGDVTHIGENPTGYDGTLCGIADEGEGNNIETPFDEREGTLRDITCVQCRDIVDFCSALRRAP